MISQRLLALARCPDCRDALEGPPEAPRCPRCGRTFSGGDGYLDLRPRVRFAETTKYADGAFHADGRYQTVSPPLLSAGLRQAMLRKFLRPSREDRIVDLGCGSGRTLVWNRDSGAYLVGVDAAPFFAGEALATIDLVVGDLRRLPLADGAFTKAVALDVWEHLSREGLVRALHETARVLAPGGALFVYSHVRKNAPIAAGLRAVNRFARWLERAGLVDLAHERLRKSDHLNPLADHGDLAQVAAEAGFRIARIRYYTPIVGAFIENVLLRLAERLVSRRAPAPAVRGTPTASTVANRKGEAAVAPGGVSAAHGPACSEGGDRPPAAVRRRIAGRGFLYAALVAATWLMKLDLVLFGGVRSGPFFALLVKADDAPRRAASEGPVRSRAGTG